MEKNIDFFLLMTLAGCFKAASNSVPSDRKVTPILTNLAGLPVGETSTDGKCVTRLYCGRAPESYQYIVAGR